MADGCGEKLAFFQAITGLEEPDLCTEILSAHNWDMELAIASFTSNAPSSSSGPPPQASPGGSLPSPSTSSPAPSASASGSRVDCTIGLLAAPRGAEGGCLIPLSVTMAEATDFQREYPADPRPHFAAEGFMHALLLTQRGFQFDAHVPALPRTPGCADLLPTNPVLIPTGGLSN